ncbi:uncharacterized protein LOC118645388 [Monomorium pharaonis]|uniref:uncharacterized protein LOC118645388 n=1 Tax=Monomorium pharaonis TaxID=307658 RepID=UPI001747BECE|nr:uncharacterized protein LOC118645388 [Monomorium pharaonis]
MFHRTAVNQVKLRNLGKSKETATRRLIDGNLSYHLITEAAVKNGKGHPFRVTKNAKLRHEELETLLIQIEAVLNSHLLTPVSSGHFLIGGPLTSSSELSLKDKATNWLSRWQHVE